MTDHDAQLWAWGLMALWSFIAVCAILTGNDALGIIGGAWNTFVCVFSLAALASVALRIDQ